MQLMTADDVAALVRTGDTIVIAGSGHAIPESLIEAVERRFLTEALPRDITSIHPGGLGDSSHRGVSRLGHSGLLKRIVW
jgi:propionate CoA-transferase